jgi:hypothetical protein
MKKTLILLLLFTSMQGYAQGIKDRFFTSFAITALADVNFGPLQEINYTGEYDNVAYKGYSKDFALGILSYQYGIRLNLIEKGPDFSVGIYVPVTASLSTGNVKFLMDGKEYDNFTNTYENKSIEGDFSTFGRVSFPAFLQFNFGAGSTYQSDKEKGMTVGIGMDMSISPIFYFDSGVNNLENFKIKRFNMMPAVNIGKRTTKGTELVEYNFKFGYVFGNKEYVNESSKLSTPGMVLMLTIGKILNY